MAGAEQESIRERTRAVRNQAALARERSRRERERARRSAERFLAEITSDVDELETPRPSLRLIHGGAEGG